MYSLLGIYGIGQKVQPHSPETPNCRSVSVSARLRDRIVEEQDRLAGRCEMRNSALTHIHADCHAVLCHAMAHDGRYSNYAISSGLLKCDK